MMVLTSALASSVSFMASRTSKKLGLSAPGFTTILSSTPATQSRLIYGLCVLPQVPQVLVLY